MILKEQSNEECAEILKEVGRECQSRIENCDEGVYTNSNQIKKEYCGK